MFKGKIEFTRYFGEWLKLYEGGEHIKDFQFTGILLGLYHYNNEDGTSEYIAFFANKDGVFKTTQKGIIWQVINAVQAGAVNYGDLVNIKYIGKEKRRIKGKPVLMNVYDIEFYQGPENPDYINEVLKDVTVPKPYQQNFDKTLEGLTNPGQGDEPPF